MTAVTVPRNFVWRLRSANSSGIGRDMPTCTFCKIISGEIPAFVAFEDEISIAFLDRRPLFHGHLLLTPKQHIATLGDLPDALLQPLFANARLLARAMVDYGAEGSFVAMNNTVSQSVPHLHVHVVPRTKGDGLRGFFWPRTKYADGEAASVCEELRAIIDSLRA